MEHQKRWDLSSTGVFLDTSFVVAVINENDAFHQMAAGLENDLKQCSHIWITEAILFEIGNSFSKSNKEQVSKFIHYCYQSPRIHVIKPDEELIGQALLLFSQYHDKDWSLTDCLSFVVMKREKISIAYSSDHHFEQAGFLYTMKI